MKHHFWMLIGCILPFLLIFLLPMFGVSGGALLPVFILAMFACHLLMMFGHGKGGSNH